MRKYYVLGFLFLLVGTLSTIPVQTFAAPGDIDGDGVADSVDLCPFVMEDNEEEIDGCPSNFVPWYDADYDGVQDHLDNCPTVKERYNKYQDEDGCPDVSPEGGGVPLADADGDGFVDNIDLCPNQPETTLIPSIFYSIAVSVCKLEAS